jgi:hypothetical protein
LVYPVFSYPLFFIQTFLPRSLLRRLLTHDE